MNKSILAAALFAAMGAFGVNTVLADDHAAGAVKYRQTVMKSIGDHMGGISMVMKGETEVEDIGLHVGEHAKGINASAMLIAGAFKAQVEDPSGSTEAKPEIWSDWDGFVKAAEKLEATSAALAEAAATGDKDAMGAALKEVGGACGVCHKAFRQKKS